MFLLGAAPGFGQEPPWNADDFACQFGDLPMMRFQRHSPSNYTLRIGDGRGPEAAHFCDVTSSSILFR
jgi:hypothetical protein